MSKSKKYSKRFLTLLLSLIMVFMFSMPVLAAEVTTPEEEISVERTQTIPSKKYECTISSGYTDAYHQYHTITGSATCTATVQWDEGVAGWISSANYDVPEVYIDGKAVTVTDTGTGTASYHNFKFSGHTLTVRLYCDAYGDVTMSYTIS